MAVPAWVIVYTVTILIGLIAGLLLRFILAIVIASAVIVFGVWLLGAFDSAVLAQLPTLSGRVVGGLSIGPEILFSVGAVVFLVGLFLGLLLTTRVRVFDRSRPSA
jgi:hypothetical protein